MRLTELHQDLSELRADLAAELEAITRLESQTFTLIDELAREEVRRIADEKKGHAAALLHHIERLDPKFGDRAAREQPREQAKEHASDASA